MSPDVGKHFLFSKHSHVIPRKRVDHRRPRALFDLIGSVRSRAGFRLCRPLVGMRRRYRVDLRRHFAEALQPLSLVVFVVCEESVRLALYRFLETDLEDVPH